MPAVTSLIVMLGTAGLILHDLLGPFAANPTTDLVSGDQ
jgi:hypothetical protein